VTTLEPVEALLVPGSVFSTFLERHPRVAPVILRMDAGRLRYTDIQQADFAKNDVVGRVVHRLLELSERFGTPGTRGPRSSCRCPRRSWRPGSAPRARP
jgi:CRP-like cAMP-binding protein